MYSPAFSALFELILSHNARIAPSNKLKNSSKMQVQNCRTYSFNITKSSPIRRDCVYQSGKVIPKLTLALRLLSGMNCLLTLPRMRSEPT